MPVKTHKYTNNDVTVIWQPEMCMHSTICFKGLIEVFDPKKRPWVNMEGATTERIIEQVRKCPSGALSYVMNNEQAPEENNSAVLSEAANVINIQVLPNGPLLIQTDCVITYADGRQETKKGNTALCRCGASANKPFCDGSHRKTGFTG